MEELVKGVCEEIWGISEGSVCVCVRRYGGISEGSVCVCVCVCV